MEIPFLTDHSNLMEKEKGQIRILQSERGERVCQRQKRFHLQDDHITTEHLDVYLLDPYWDHLR